MEQHASQQRIELYEATMKKIQEQSRYEVPLIPPPLPIVWNAGFMNIMEDRSNAALTLLHELRCAQQQHLNLSNQRIVVIHRHSGPLKPKNDRLKQAQIPTGDGGYVDMFFHNKSPETWFAAALDKWAQKNGQSNVKFSHRHFYQLQLSEALPERFYSAMVTIMEHFIKYPTYPYPQPPDMQEPVLQSRFVLIPTAASFTPYVDDWFYLAEALARLSITLITISRDGKFFVPLVEGIGRGTYDFHQIRLQFQPI